MPKKKVVETPVEKINARTEKALKVSIVEGSATNFAVGIADTYVVPLANTLKATSFQIGFLNAISGLAAPLAQLYGDKLLERYARKKIVRTFVFLQALTWLPIALLSILFAKGIAVSSLPWLLITLYTLLAALGGIAYPAWFSWMGDIVPESSRGKYFGKRTTIVGIVGLAASLIGGVVWDISQGQGKALLGFTILFSLAACGRLFSFFTFGKQYAPAFKAKKKDYFSLLSFVKRMDNYGKFAVGHAVFNFALMIASPFFALYMLNDLKLSPLWFAVISMSSGVFQLLFAPIIGRLADKFGNKRFFGLACMLFGINPLLWMIIKEPFALIFLQVVAGFANAAMNLAVTNFTYDAVKKEHRALCISYTNVLAGVGVFLGSILGGMIVQSWHPSFMNAFMFVFLVSAIGRLTVSIFLIPRIKEQKKVKPVPLHLPHFQLFHPFRSIHAEIHWLRHVTK